MEPVKEGKADILVYTGEATKKMPVFYNHEMRNQRDLTISVLSAYQRCLEKNISICDPLAGSGVRGIRIIKEVDGVENVLMNDVYSKAVDLIKTNVERNKVKAEITHKDAKTLLLENKCVFDFIDIDPFGSPVQFLEASAFAIRRGGLFTCTATDTGPLAGSFAKTCYRKYGVMVCKTDFYKELAVRVLITKIQRAFALYNSAFDPILCHSNHFFRVFGAIEKGKTNVDKNLDKIGFVSYCQKCLNRVFKIQGNCCCGNEMFLIGPIWLGKIKDNGFIEKVNAEQERRGFKIRFIDEIDEPLYYDLHMIYKKHKTKHLKKEVLIERLKHTGYKASGTNFSGTGIKTDANIDELMKSII